MKKRITCALLVLVMLAGALPSSALFTDIVSDSERWAAESLASLGIVNGTGGSAFNPNGTLTRAEFCKMAVLAAGFSEVSLYSSYTIFPDVLASEWFAPYVNAAVRKYQIIRGDSAGNFNPNTPITYGEAVTILLRMLGYTVEDIGYFWPRDDALKAEQIGLNRGMRSFSTSDSLTRGQAAILLRNLLMTEQKEGGLYITKAFRTGDLSVLAATWETDTELANGEVRLYAGEDASIVTSSTALSRDLVGLRGTPVYAQTGNKLLGFIVDTENLETAVVQSTSIDAITTADGSKISIPRSCKLLVTAGMVDYTASYYDLRPGAQIYLYRDDGGSVSLVTGGQTTLSLASVGVYGVDDIVFVRGSTILKNGSEITEDEIDKFDVVSYVSDEKTYYVSDDRVTLLYEDAKPSYASPSTITAGGHTFSISEEASRYFQDLTFNRTITLLFDYNGNVAAAFNSARVGGKVPAILTELGGEATVKLLSNGLELKGTPSFSGFPEVDAGDGEGVSSLYAQVGRIVGFSQDNQGRFTFSTYSFRDTSAGDIDPVKGTVGRYEFSPEIRIFEEPAEGMPLNEITQEDLGPVTLSASKVRHIERDSAGKVSLLVVSNVTGNGFTYGLISQTQTQVPAGEDLESNTVYRTQYTLKLRTAESTQEYTTFRNPGLRNTSSMVPGGIATSVLAQTYSEAPPAFKLERTATVGRDDFDTREGVRVGNVFVELADDVLIYAKSIDRFLTLNEARSNFSTFEIYCDRDPGDGGTVRIILVS